MRPLCLRTSLHQWGDIIMFIDQKAIGGCTKAFRKGSNMAYGGEVTTRCLGMCGLCQSHNTTNGTVY